MRKVFTLACTLLACAALLGFGTGSKDAATVETLKLFHAGPAQADQDMVIAKLNEYLAKFGIKVDMTQIGYGDYESRMGLVLASGEKADVMFTAPWCGFWEQQESGGFLSLDDLLATYGKDIIKYMSKDMLYGGRIGGKLYAIPTMEWYVNNSGFHMRKDLLDKYRIDKTQVKSMAEFGDKVLKVIKEREPDIVPLYLNQSGLGELKEWWELETTGTFLATVRQDDPSLKMVCVYFDPQFETIMKMVRQWYLAGYINKDVTTATQASEDMMKAGTVFSFMHVVKPGFTEQLSVYTGYPLTDITWHVPFKPTQRTAYAIPRQAVNPAKSMTLINLIHTDKYAHDLLVDGIEGVHYLKTSIPNVIAKIPGAKYDNAGANFQFGNQTIGHIYVGEPADKWSRLLTFINNAKPSPLLGFVPNWDKVTDIKAALANTESEYVSVMTGAVDVDTTLAAFRAKLKANGIDTLLAEMQKQVDAWKATR